MSEDEHGRGNSTPPLTEDAPPVTVEDDAAVPGRARRRPPAAAAAELPTTPTTAAPQPTLEEASGKYARPSTDGGKEAANRSLLPLPDAVFRAAQTLRQTYLSDGCLDTRTLEYTCSLLGASVDADPEEEEKVAEVAYAGPLITSAGALNVA
jgi:hypothetical protein